MTCNLFIMYVWVIACVSKNDYEHKTKILWQRINNAKTLLFKML